MDSSIDTEDYLALLPLGKLLGFDTDVSIATVAKAAYDRIRTLHKSNAELREENASLEDRIQSMRLAALEESERTVEERRALREMDETLRGEGGSISGFSCVDEQADANWLFSQQEAVKNPNTRGALWIRIVGLYEEIRKKESEIRQCHQESDKARLDSVKKIRAEILRQMNSHLDYKNTPGVNVQAEEQACGILQRLLGYVDNVARPKKR